MSRLALLGLALLVAVAGCSTFGPTEEPTTAAPEATVEPATTVTTTTTAEPTNVVTPTPSVTGRHWSATGDLDGVTLPPGVSEAGVNGTRLAEAHAAALENRSFTLGIQVTEDGNRTGVVEKISASRDRVWVRAVGPAETEVRYVEDGTRYVKETREGETTYRSSSYGAALASTADYALATFLGNYLAVANFSPVGTLEREDRTFVLLEASITDYAGSNVSVFRSQALVDRRGVIRGFVLYGEGTREGSSFTFGFAVSVDAIGETSVPKPDWLDRATEA